MLRDTCRSSKPEYRAQYPDARPFCWFYATRIPVPARTLTGLAAAVRLRLRVAIGLQALQRCSGFLNRKARGSTVTTHQFAVVDSGGVDSRKRPGTGFMRTVPRLLNYQLSRPSTINLSAGVAQQRQQQFRKLPGNPPHGSASLPVGPNLRNGVMDY